MWLPIVNFIPIVAMDMPLNIDRKEVLNKAQCVPRID